jgi:hypothetical protein
VGCAHEDGTWVAPLGTEAQAVEAVDNELEAPKVNGLDEGETVARQAFTIGKDDERK